MADLSTRWVSAMRRGDFEAAWALCDDVLQARDPGTRDDPSLPYHRRWVWDGRPLEGRNVLVRCYHGLGDTIQFARFLPLLARRAARVTVEAQPQLLPLLSPLAEGMCFVPFDPAHPLASADCDIEIMELGHALRAAPSDAPAPYLRAERAALPAGTIGLCHTVGNWDHERRVPAELLRSLCEERTCLTLMPEPTILPVLNPGGCSLDITVTASLIASCALVITVDTMVAHLAGALGRPTWLLLKAEPDWRWCPEQRDSLWYSRMRLYPQAHPGDWASAIRRVDADLAVLDATALNEAAR